MLFGQPIAHDWANVQRVLSSQVMQWGHLFTTVLENCKNSTYFLNPSLAMDLLKQGYGFAMSHTETCTIISQTKGDTEASFSRKNIPGPKEGYNLR